MFRAIREILKPLLNRDYFQSIAVYKSEGAFYSVRFNNLCECVIYFRKIWNSDFIKNNFPDRCKADVKFALGDKALESHVNRVTRLGKETDATLYMGRDRRCHTDLVILHEIAHLCAPIKSQHGPEYVAIYLSLIEEFLGKIPAKNMLYAFKRNGVSLDKPKTLMEDISSHLGRVVVGHMMSVIASKDSKRGKTR